MWRQNKLSTFLPCQVDIVLLHSRNHYTDAAPDRLSPGRITVDNLKANIIQIHTAVVNSYKVKLKNPTKTFNTLETCIE